MIEAAGTRIDGAYIKVVGVGGGGGNAVNSMIEADLEGVEFIAANTDGQALGQNLAQHHLQLGDKLTKGLGAGGNPEIGRKAAREDQQRIAEYVAGADMVFITAGMGGGTGTGAAPVVAGVARDSGALTVGVVTKPFPFEGSRRMAQAEQGIDELRAAVDALIVIPNEKLLEVAGSNMTLADAFAMANTVLLNAVRGISDIIVVPGLINVDFADVRAIMSEKGRALMGTGTGRGENRAVEAANAAISSPFLEEASISGATGILVNITGGPDLSLMEVSAALNHINDVAHPDCNTIFGSVINPDMVDSVKVTVVATGFDAAHQVTEPEDHFMGRRDTGWGERPQLRRTEAPEEQAWVHAASPVSRRPRVAAVGSVTPPPVPPSAAYSTPRDDGRPDYDRPTYVRRQGGGAPPPREPVTSNPFAHSDQSEFDTPAYLRK